MAFIHTTRHELCSKTISAFFTTTNSPRQTAATTLPQVPSRYTAPQVRDTTNGVSTARQQGAARPDSLHRCRLGRMPGYTQKYIWLRDPIPWDHSPLWFTYTIRIVALSSAESEFYAIGTGATEALHLKNFLGEILHNKISLKIHTDSTSGKSMATRIGVSKPAKHIELKYMFIQHLIHDGILSIHKINTKHNPSDILTKHVQREVLQWHLHTAGIRLPDNWGESSYSSFTHQYTNTTSAHVSAAYLIEYIMYTFVYLIRVTWLLWYSLTRTWSPHLSLHHSPQGLHDGFSFQFFLQYKFLRRWWWQLHTTRWAVGSIVDLCRLCFNMSSDTSSTLQNMVHRGYYASLWIGWGSYSTTYTRGYVWNQYIPLDVQHVLGRPAADPVHAAVTMALHHAGTALSRFMPADVQHGLLQYTAQFTIHVKENFDENENLGSQDTRDKLQAKISGSTTPATLPGATPETALGTSWSTTVTSSTRLNLWSTWLDTATVLLQRFLTTCE